MKLLLATTALTCLLAAPGWTQSGGDGSGTVAAASGQVDPGSASASQEEARSGVQDIIVTAQRRAEQSQDVPIAISAFSADQLATQGVSNTLQLGQFIPNFVANNNTGLGSANAYFLRGLGNVESIATFDPPIGTYVDDIYLSRQNSNNLSLFDVERIEVLRGPQGTLFGRNTTGGAVSVILRKPGKDFGGYAEVGYGRFNKKLARASLDIPLTDSLAFKVSGYYQDDDGYATNITTGDRLNDDDGWGARLALHGDLNANSTFDMAYAHIVNDAENILNFTCNPRDPTQCKGRFVTTGLREGKDAATTPYAPNVISGRKANFLQGNRTSTDLVTANLTLGLSDRVSVSFITGYVNLIQRFGLDFFDGRAGPTIVAGGNPAFRGDTRGSFVIVNDGKHEQFSQEIKLNASLGDGLIDLVAGGFYLDERNRTDFADLFSLSSATQIVLGDRILRNTTRALAGYAQGDLNLGERITLTAGVRYTDETKQLSIRDNRPACAVAAPAATCLFDRNLVAANGRAIPTKQNVGIWTPRFAVNYKPNSDVLIFASATRGFKSGGWNARATAPSELLPFGPEKIWSYELGLKSDLFDRRVRLNLTAYYADSTDLQIISGLVRANGAIGFITGNFADYRNKGVEAELTVVPVDGLTLYANVGYQDDEYRVNRNAPATDQFGVLSVNAQQAACRAQLALGQIPGGANTSPVTTPPTPPNNAPACAVGIVTARGDIATPVRTPDLSLAVGGSYVAELGGSGLSLIPSINASYAGDAEVQTNNFSIYSGSITGTNGTFINNPYGGAFLAGSRSQDHWLVNASLTLRGPANRWQLSAECVNCFNEEFVQSALSNTTYINQPMTWMVRGKVNF